MHVECGDGRAGSAHQLHRAEALAGFGGVESDVHRADVAGIVAVPADAGVRRLSRGGLEIEVLRSLGEYYIRRGGQRPGAVEGEVNSQRGAGGADRGRGPFLAAGEGFQ